MSRTFRGGLLACVLFVLVTGCASSKPLRHGSDEDELAAAEHQLARDVAALAAPTAEGRPVDCARAASLRDNICLLADRICVLVGRDGTIPDGPARCERARLRCREARARVNAVCVGRR
jgi:outer membrane murein-binding lipoprotein Lpp